MERQTGWGTERAPPSMFEKRQHSKDPSATAVHLQLPSSCIKYWNLGALHRPGDEVFFVKGDAGGEAKILCWHRL